MLTESQRQEQYRRTVYEPAQDARKAYWQSMWERSMHNPKKKDVYSADRVKTDLGTVQYPPEPVEMPGDLPYPENPKNTWTGDPWKGVRGTAAPFTDKDLSILTEANGLVHGDRQASYGHPAVDFSRTAALVNVLLASKLSKDLGPEDIATLMVCVKLSRECHEPARDNLVDAAGYLECRARVLRFLGDTPRSSKDAL